jgi:hypothetical protein
MDDESLDLATLDYLPRDKRIKRLRPCCTAFNPCQQCSKIRPEERILEDAEYSMIQRRILADQMKKDRLNNLQVKRVLFIRWVRPGQVRGDQVKWNLGTHVNWVQVK